MYLLTDDRRSISNLSFFKGVGHYILLRKILSSSDFQIERYKYFITNSIVIRNSVYYF